MEMVLSNYKMKRNHTVHKVTCVTLMPIFIRMGLYSGSGIGYMQVEITVLWQFLFEISGLLHLL